MKQKMKQRFRSGGLAAWSVYHPVGISMLTLAVFILGLFSLHNLRVNLLPHIIAPDILVRVNNPGVPASIMEDQVTRQLEEQLAITEGATAIQSRTSEGRSAVDLSFPYGTDIDTALRDASIRLERARRFLPTSDEPPVIYKRDPAQIAVLELVVSSFVLDPIQLRSWVDYTFSKWFLNLPGVASVEVGGGLQREIEILPDEEKLASVGITLQSLEQQIKTRNMDVPGGRMFTGHQVLGARTAGRFQSLEELRNLPLTLTGKTQAGNDNSDDIHLKDVATIIDGHKDEKLRIRLNKIPGVKMSIQKQPQANTVAVVDEVRHRLHYLQQQKVIPRSTHIAIVGDQSTFVRHAINNASYAAISGALLAMLVIYIFLGSIQRTLIIGSAIPIGVMVTFILMDAMHLTLNIMTLGGLALGTGLLIDSTIVMLENISRHQAQGELKNTDAIDAATEVNSPIVASTTTNLAALLPFLFIGGLSGLLFRDLIITLSAAMAAALVVALTLVPALGAQIKKCQREPLLVKRILYKLTTGYKKISQLSLKHSGLTLLIFCLLLLISVMTFIKLKAIYLPVVDEGIVSIYITGDSGMELDEMDSAVDKIENLLLADANVKTVFTTAGGFVFGRSEYQNSNRSAIKVQLVPRSQRFFTTQQWLKQARKKINRLNLAGFRFYLKVNSVRGVRTSNNDDDISLHIQGNNLQTLRRLGNKAVRLLEKVPGLSNLNQSYDEVKEELLVKINRQRASEYAIDSKEIGHALRIALDGDIISDYIEGDKSFDIRMRLKKSATHTIEALENIIVTIKNGSPVRLGDIATLKRSISPSRIIRYQQQRIVEISASYKKAVNHQQVLKQAMQKLRALNLPHGYVLYDNNSNKTLQESRRNSLWILALAVFMVFVVMAVQYESLLNPLIIILSIPFALIGVASGFLLNTSMPLSMPVWLGLIMLTGIVVNNAIVLVEQIEIERESGLSIVEAIQQAGRLRLRPILMTTLTTVFGMLPLALGLGEGAEMLQPLAFVVVWGLSISMLVSLILVPVVYRLFHSRQERPRKLKTAPEKGYN